MKFFEIKGILIRTYYKINLIILDLNFQWDVAYITRRIKSKHLNYLNIPYNRNVSASGIIQALINQQTGKITLPKGSILLNHPITIENNIMIMGIPNNKYFNIQK